jgi:peptide/nickel transport system permease protein
MTASATDLNSKPAFPYRQRVWRRFRSNRRAVFGMGIIFLLILVALGAPVIAGNVPVVCHYEGAWHAPAMVTTVRRLPLLGYLISAPQPFSRAGFDAKASLSEDDFALWPPIAYGPTETSRDSLAPPSSRHWLGTDEVGRDIASRMAHGTVVSVQVGIVSMGIAAALGILFGALAGYFGGWVDMVVSRVIEIVICFPDFFLILSVMVWLEPNITNVMVVIGLTRWTGVARYTRGEFLRLREADFVLAARASGASAGRIILRHLVPNAMAPVLVTVSFGVAQAILIEAGLSWLGFGVQPPAPSWGNLLRSAFENFRLAPHLVYPPCVAIFVAVMAHNLVGDCLRDAIDPRIDGRRGAAN